jgi:NAD(P)-dependent dehydrogenase (short-subunit alcohol dehydrogenase family)
VTGAAAAPADRAASAAPVVLITGATGPLGRAAAARFSLDGARLVLVGTDLPRLEALAADLKLNAARTHLATADLRDADAARAMAASAIERFGRIDVLLHLVGGWAGGTGVVGLDHAEVRRMLDQHLWSTLHAVQAVAPGMIERGFGRVLAISSPLAGTPGPKGASYAIAKSAEEIILRSLAKEAAGTGVTANLLLVRAIAGGEGAPASAVPPEELVETLAYLASPAAATVTGQRIAIGGA